VQFFSQVFDAVKAWLTAVITWYLDLWVTMLKPFVTAYNAVVQFFSQVFDAVKNFAKNSWAYIKTNFIDLLMTAFEAIINPVGFALKLARGDVNFGGMTATTPEAAFAGPIQNQSSMANSSINNNAITFNLAPGTSVEAGQAAAKEFYSFLDQNYRQTAGNFARNER